MAGTELEALGLEVESFDPPDEQEIAQTYLPRMWVEDKQGKHINENTFAEMFTVVNGLRYNNGLFYTKTGKATEEILSKDIWESIKDSVTKDVDRTTKRLLGAVKLASTVEKLETKPNIIPFQNGDLDITTRIMTTGLYSPTAYRFPIPLKLDLQAIPNFSAWLHNLFTDDDILTFQEYLGYCLVPTTRAQKALFLVGEGGIGKSILGVILEAILGSAVTVTPNTQEFLADKFKLPELEHCLVLYDDDLDNTALTGTGLYKKLITSQLSITADRKYGQPFKFRPYAKLVACCNEMLTSTYDNTDGFYRRLLPILTKPKSPDFVPDLHFEEKIRAEATGIVQWAIMGLNRLISHNWILHESERTRNYLAGRKSLGNHLPDFLADCFDFAPENRVTTEKITKVYAVWCSRNALEGYSSRFIQRWLADNAERYRIESSRHISNGKNDVRGYKGLQFKPEWESATHVLQLKGK